jgi:hypothetical protein
MSSKTFAPVDQQVEKSTEASMQGVEENNKRYQKPAIIPTRQINEHIFGTIKDNGVTITLI